MHSLFVNKINKIFIQSDYFCFFIVLVLKTTLLLMNPTTTPSFLAAKTKLEYYCVYQERCHNEVQAKLQSLKMSSQEADAILLHLLEHDFLNESRFACSFARGKHRIKLWGKRRIVNELKARNISTYNINLALKEIGETAYLETFHTLAEKQWESVSEKNNQKKLKKVSDFLLRKGYESGLVYEKVGSWKLEVKKTT
jgi:regulatory protein